MSPIGYRVPEPTNEPIFTYAPGEAARLDLKESLKRLSRDCLEIPCVIGGKEVRTGNIRQVRMPHSHHEVIAKFHVAGPQELQAAAEAAQKAKAHWENLAWTDRVKIFLKAADLLAGPYRSILNGATMLGQSKNVYQAEIDSACELIDFFRFNAYFYQQIQDQQPLSVPGVSNRLHYRALEGFVLAITPFNFTAIGGNLAAAPAMMGNTVVWKPSDTQMLSAYCTLKLLQEAGLPDGVINFVAADGPVTSQALLGRRDLAGVHFTGSTATFQHIYKTVSENVGNYRSYPRIVGETGGKDFVFAHPSADAEALVVALVRGAFEYQGQKCSAASRAYIPQSIWTKIKDRLVEEVRAIKMGDVRDFRNLVNAVIDERSFNKISSYLEHAKQSNDAEILVGGGANSEIGYFIEPTVILAKSPTYKSMCDEIFGPVLTVYVYEDSKLDETLKLCDETSPYALTGAVFAQDRAAVDYISLRLQHAAGNFYINDKPTGAVVGQQPFGGARASGTNDKAGSIINLYRWASPRTIKENLSPPKSVGYPFMDAE